MDRIRVVNAADANLRLNPNNGALAGTDTNLSPAGQLIDNVAYDRNFDGNLLTGTPPGVTTLYTINLTTGMLQTQGGLNGTPSPNLGALMNVGPLNVTVDANSFAGFDISAAGAARAGEAFAVFDGDATATIATGLYRINLTTGAATLIGLVGPGTTELTGLALVPDGRVVVGSGLGANGDVRLLDPTTGATLVGPIVPFGGYQGGVVVAAGDVNRDSVPDAVVAAVDATSQGHVKVFDGTTGAQLFSFLAFPGFAGTINVGSGDVNGDGFADIIVVANGALGHVKAFSGADGTTVLASFLAYSGFMGNVTISAADFDNNGTDEIVTGAAINGHVKVFNADGTPPAALGALASFHAYDGFTFGPIAVAAGDVNGDGRADIVTLAGTGSRGHTRAFSGNGGAEIASFFAFPTNQTTSPSVGLADANLDGIFDIRVTPGADQQANVLTFDLLGMPLGSVFPAFTNFAGGATIGGARV